MTVRKVQAEQMDLAEVGAALAVSGSLQDSSEKSQPNGYASLDGSGKVPASELPASVVGALSYQGGFTPPAPALPAAVTGNKGWYYVASTAGTDPTSGLTFEIGDWAVSNGTTWDKIDNSDNQVITLTGDVTGSGAGSFATTLSNTGVAANTYKSVTVDAKGRVTAGTNPTTLAGYGISDAQPLDSDLTDIAGLTPTNDDFLQRKAGAWTNRTPTQATADLNVFATGLKGLVPAPTASDSSRVLLGNATWGRYNLRGYSGSVIALSDGTLAPETTVFSQTVPGGSLGTSGQVRVQVGGLIINSTGNRQYTIRIKYGGSTFFGDLTSNVATTAGGAPFSTEFIITSTGATTTQSISGNIRIGVGTTGTVVGQGDLASTNVINAAFYGPSPGAVDSTVDQTVQVTFTSNSANTTQTFTLLNYAIEAR